MPSPPPPPPPPPPGPPRTLPAGFKTSQTTTDIGVLVGIYFLMVLCALGLFYLRLPRQSTRTAQGRRAAAAAAASRLGSAVRSASGRLRVATNGKEPGAAAVRADGTARSAASGMAAPPSAAAHNSAGGGGRRWQFWNPVFGRGGGSSAAPAGGAAGKPAAAAPTAMPPPPAQTPLASGSGRLRVSTSMDRGSGSAIVADVVLPALSVSANAAQQQAEARQQKKFRQDFKAAMAAARKQRQEGGQQ